MADRVAIRVFLRVTEFSPQVRAHARAKEQRASEKQWCHSLVEAMPSRGITRLCHGRQLAIPFN